MTSPDDLSNTINVFSSLGVGGILAAFAFYFYRKDVKQYTDQWKGQSELLMGVVKDNTTAITKNTMVVETLHRRLDGELRHHREEDRIEIDNSNSH